MWPWYFDTFSVSVEITQYQVLSKLHQSNDTSLQSFLYLKKFCLCPITTSSIDLIRCVLCPLLQQLQPIQSVLWWSWVVVYLTAVQCNEMPPKHSKVWLYVMDIKAHSKGTGIGTSIIIFLSDTSLKPFVFIHRDIDIEDYLSVSSPPILQKASSLQLVNIVCAPHQN